MSDAKIVLSAENKTRAAFAAAKANLASLQGSAEGLNASFGAFGKVFGAAFAGLSFTAFVKSTAGGIDKLNDLKDATGASVENISALEDVAARTGASFDDVATSLVKFNAALNSADAGSQNANIFKQLGLDAEALKKADPAEALRQTAVALAQFADDGNKARITQALFGKSIKEAAPFLNDLATQTKLVGTVTTEAAIEAEKFQQQLSRMEKNGLDLARALSGPVIAGINETIAAFKSAREQGDSTWQFIIDRYNQSNGGAARSAADRTKDLTGELTRIDALLDKGMMMEQRRNELLQKRLTLQAQLNQVKIAEAVKLADGIGPDPALRQKSVGNLPEPDKKPAVKAKKEKDDRASIAAAIVAGEEQAAQDVTEAWQAWEKIQLANTKETAEATTLMWKQVFDAIDDEQDRAIEDGQAFLKKRVDDLQVFADQAARNIQDALGNTIEDTLKGNFDNIGEAWGNLLIRMASEAAAARLGKELFGDFAKTGNVGGSFGDLLKWFSSLNVPSFDVGTDFVPRDMLAVVHKGERIETAAENRAGGSRGGVTVVVNQTNHIDSRTDSAAIGQMIAAGNAQSQRAIFDKLHAMGAV